MKLSDEVREMVESETNQLSAPPRRMVEGYAFTQAVKNVRARLIEAVDASDSYSRERADAVEKLTVFLALYS